MNNELGKSVPRENFEAYCCIFEIETVLRELIVDRLSRVAGTKWYKQRIPEGIRIKSMEGLQYERSARWTRMIPYHPIYYVDFPDLKTIISQKNNWNEAFEEIFARNDIFQSTLSELEPIRNKVAHNRRVTMNDWSVVEAAAQKVMLAIGPQRFRDLASRCTCATDLVSRLESLQKEAQICYARCNKCESLATLDVWRSVSNEWWFDDDYLDCKTEAIRMYFELMIEYSNLPRARGEGYRLESWVEKSAIALSFERMQSQFSKLLKQKE